MVQKVLHHVQTPWWTTAQEESCNSSHKVNSESILLEHLNSMPCHPGSHPWDWTGLWCLVLTVAPVWKQTLNDMNSYDSKGLTGFHYISLSLLQRTVNERIKSKPTRKCGTHVNKGISGPGSATPGDAKCRKVQESLTCKARSYRSQSAKVSNSGTRDVGTVASMRSLGPWSSCPDILLAFVLESFWELEHYRDV